MSKDILIFALLSAAAVIAIGYLMGSNIIAWYAGRYVREQRRYRRMLRDYCKPWTGRALIVVAILIASIALWVLAPPALADAGALYVITASPYANIREKPDKSSIDLGDARQGDTVRGIYTDGWVLATGELLADGTEIRLSVEPSRGYIRADLLTLKGYPTGGYTNKSGGRVRIRREPDGDHAAWLKAGGTVEVLRWVDVNGAAWACTVKGYLDGRYLEEEGK